MREELMAHLAALVEEESQRGASEHDAIMLAAERLGEPTELSAQLQATVPAWDAIRRWDESLSFRPGEPVLRRALRLAEFIFVTILLLFAVVALLCALFARGQSLATLPVWLLLLFAAPVLSLLTFAFTLLEEAMRQAIHNARERPVGRAVLIGLASLLVVPATAFMVEASATRDLASSVSYAARGAIASLLVPACLYLGAGLTARHIRYLEEWASLDIA
jgi:hypothetical protein